ncbi:DUF4352 domain-containing protein [Gordonia sp. MP11Mi]|uniref:DUF4352 domain-containing protein n=1 Tax=Gordonia sp. MP11Mi TaxID=3022769 RepID=A0AA97CWC0_9ACTN
MLSSPKFSLRSAAVAAVAAVALVATIASGEEDTAEKVDGETGTQQTADFAVGDTVKLGDWQVKVHGVQDPYISQNEFITPDAGNRYVVVDTEVTNKSDSSQVVSSVMCFELRDETNRSYDVTITDNVDTSLDGDVSADTSRRGSLSYEVPETSKELQLQFKCDLFGSGSALINLS